MDDEEYARLLEQGQGILGRTNVSNNQRNLPTKSIGDHLEEKHNRNAAKQQQDSDQKLSESLQMEEGVQGFGENLGRFLVGTLQDVAAATADVYGVLDFDVHHLFADTEGENWKNIEKHASKDKVASALVSGWGAANDVMKSTFQFLDNTMGDGEHQVGNYWTRSAAKLRHNNELYNKVNTGSSKADWALNGISSLAGSIIGNLTPAGLAKTAVKKGMSKGLASAITTAAMTQSVSLNIAQGVYDDTYDYILEEADPGYKQEKERIHNSAKIKFLQEHPEDYANKYGDAEAYANQQSSLYKQEFIKKNPTLAKKAAKAGTVGADTAIKVNTMFAFLNMGMSKIALTKDISTRAFKAGAKPKTKLFGEAKDYIVEGSFEAMEESITENLAENIGLASGKGESYSWSDAYEDLATYESLDSAFWGFLGGAGSVAGGNAMSYKGRKAQATRAKEQMEKQDAIFKDAGSPTIEEYLKVSTSVRKQNAIAKQAIELARQGKKTESNLLFDQVLSEQSLQSFETGTTENLIATYNFLAKDKNLSPEARKNALKAIEDIKSLEKIYNETQDLDLRNTKALYANKATVFNAKKGVEHLDVLIAAKETQLLAEIESAKSGGHLPSLKFQQDYMDKGGDFVDTEQELEFDIADLDTERKFDNEGHAAKHKTYVDTINEFQSAAQLKLLKENRKQGVQIIADSNKKFNELTSKKHQKELAVEEHLINRLKDVDNTNPFLGFTSLKMAINKSMTEDSVEKFSAVLDNYFKPYENKLSDKKLNAIKKTFLDKQKVIKNSQSNQARGTVQAIVNKDKEKRGIPKAQEDSSLEEFEEIANESKPSETNTAAELEELAKQAEQNGDIAKRDEYLNKIKEQEQKQNNREIIDDNPDTVNTQGLDSIMDNISWDSTDTVEFDDPTDSTIDQIDADEGDVLDNQKQSNEITEDVEGDILEEDKPKRQSFDDIDVDGDIEESLDFGDKLDLDPMRLRSDLSQGQIDALTRIVRNARKAKEREMGRPISFKEFVETFIDKRGFEKAKDMFSALADSWENQGANFKIENAEMIYDDLFNSTDLLFKELDEILEASTELVDTPEEAHEVLEKNNEEKVIDEINKPEYRDQNNQPIPFSVSSREDRNAEEGREPDNILHVGFVTNETDPGFAYVSRRSRRTDDKSGSSYEYVEEHLNQESDLDNPHDLLHREKYQPGTKLQIRVPDNYENIAVTAYSPNGEKKESLPFSKWVEKYEVEVGSQEWLDKLPMMMYNSNNESVALVRDNNWINKVKFREKEGGERELAIEKNNKIRKAVFEAFNKDVNNSVSITITKKGNGVYEGSKISRDKPLVSLREGGGMNFLRDENGEFVLDEKTNKKIPVAESQVAIWDDTDKLLKVNGEQFPMDQLVNSKDFPFTTTGGAPIYTYEIRRTGSRINKDGKLEPTYTAFAPMRPPVTDEMSKQNVIQALGLFLLSRTKSQSVRDSVMPAIMQIKQKTGIDISKYDNKLEEGIKAFIGQYIRVYPISKDSDTNAKIAEEIAANKGMKGKPYVVIKAGVIYLGIGGETTKSTNAAGQIKEDLVLPIYINPGYPTDQKTFSYFTKSVKKNITGPNSKLSQMFFSEDSFDKDTGELISKGNPNGFKHAADRTSEEKNRNMVNISEKNGKLVVEDSGDYSNYLLDNLETPIQSHNIGTEENPEWQPRIQPLISYALTSELNETPKSNEITSRNLNQASPKVTEAINRDRRNEGEIIVSENQQQEINEKQEVIDNANEKIEKLEAEKAELDKETKTKVEPVQKELSTDEKAGANEGFSESAVEIMLDEKVKTTKKFNETYGVTTIVLKNSDGKVIGSIATSNEKDGYEGISINVSSDYQGKGISKHLYNLALADAKSRGLKGLYSVDAILKTADKSKSSRKNFVTSQVPQDSKMRKELESELMNEINSVNSPGKMGDPITLITDVSDNFIEQGATSYESKQTEEPATTEDVDAQKAEIKERWEEALANISFTKDGNGLVKDDTWGTMFSERISLVDSIKLGFAEVATKEELINNINAKYELELAALETQQTEEITAEETPEVTEQKKEIDEKLEKENDVVEDARKSIDKTKTKAVTKEHPLTPEQQKENIKVESEIEKLNDKISKADAIIDSSDSDMTIAMQKAVIEEAQKEIEKLQESANVPEVEVVNEAPVAQYTEDEIKATIQDALRDTTFISDDGLLFDPTELTDDETKEIVKDMLKIPGLASHHQYQLVDFMYNEVARKMNFEENTKADKELLIAEVMKTFDEIVGQQMTNFINRRDILMTATDNADAQKLVAKYDNAIKYVQNIINNKDVIAKDAVKKVFKYTGVTETKENDPTFEDGNERDKIFSKTFLEESGKDSSSYTIRRFLGGIQDRNLEGEPVTGFLGLPSYIPFDVMWSTTQNMLANSYPDFNEMMEILSENTYAKPVMDELISKLKAADNQTKNQFVSLMAKKNTGMEFIMYSVSGKGSNQEYTLQVYNTNQTTLTSTIQNRWFNDFKMKKSGLVKNINGEYHIDSEKAGEVLNEYRSFTEKPNFIPRKANQILSNIIANNKGNIQLGVDIQGENSKLVNSVLPTNETRTIEVVDSKNQKSLYTVTKNKDGLITVKEYKQSPVLEMISTKKWTQEGNDIIKDWLGNFGIELSDGTIQELVYKGMWSGKKISFAEMFNTSSEVDSPNLFGNLANFLSVNVKTKDGEFSKEINNPLRNSIFRTLASMESKYSKNITPTAFRDGGKTIQGFTVSKFITDRAVMLSEVGEKGERLRENLSNTPFSHYSMWLKMLTDGKTSQGDFNKFRNKFEVTHLGLNAIKELNKDLFGVNNITKIADADHELTKLGLFMDQKIGTSENYQGKSAKSVFKTRMAKVFSPTMSDKTTMTIVKTAVLDLHPSVNFDKVEDENGDLVIQANDSLVDLLYEQLLLPEINRIIDFHKKGGKTNIKGYDKGAGMFLMFPEANKLEFTVEEELDEVATKEEGHEVKLRKNKISLIDAIAKDPHNINLETIQDQLGPEIHKLIQGYLKSELENKLSVWTEAGFIETKIPTEGAEPVVTGFKFFDKKYMEKFDDVKLPDEKIKYAALDFIINSLIANTNSMMVFAGDPAMYYKSKSSDPIQAAKDTFNNIGKRLANQIAPGNILADSQDNSYTQICLEDIDTISSNVEFLAKLLDKKEFNRKEWDRIQRLPTFTESEKNTKSKELKSFYKKYPKIEPYLNVEGTDAQEYTTWQEHLYVLEKMGKTPDVINQSGNEMISMEDIERARALFSSGIGLDQMNKKDKALLKLVMQPIKPVYTGQIFDNAQGVMRTVYIKSSSFPLIPQLTKGMQIDTLRQAMEQLESKSLLKDKNGKPIPNSKPTKTVRASYQSANKVGAMSNAVKLFDNKNAKMNSFAEDTVEIQFLQKKLELTKGKRKKEIAKEIEKLRKESNITNLADRMEKASLTLDRANFRIQQDVPFKSAKRNEDYVSLGTQTTKLVLGDGVTDMEGFNYNGNKNTTGKKLQEEYISNFDQLISLKRSQLFDQLGIDINTGKPYDIKKSALKLQGILKEEAENRGYSRQVIEALTVTFIKRNGKVVDAKFKIPLWISAESNRFEALLNAVVTNRLAKIKMPGNSYVAGSQEGFSHMEDYTGDHSKIIYTSSWTGELKGAEFDEDGNLKKTQVFLPSKFRDNDGNMLDLFKKDDDGKYIYVIQEKKGGPFKLNEKMFDKELLSNISFRIPTSAHMSMADVEIVGILPYESGDLMIVPRNLTVQVGLDFDIDKQTNYQLYHTLNEKTGKLEVTKGDMKELQRQIKLVKDKMQEKTTVEIEDEIQDAKNANKESVSENNNEIARLKEQKGNEVLILNQLWEKELNLKSSIDLLTNEIVSLNKTKSNVNGVDVTKEIKKQVASLRKEKKQLRSELKETIKERLKLKNSNKILKEDISEAYEKKAAAKKEAIEKRDALVKEKQDKIQQNKERMLFIKSAEKLYEKLLKNEIIKIHSAVLSSPQMQAKIGKVLSIQNAKDQADDIENLKSPSFDTDTPNYFTPMSDEYQKKTMVAGADGQTGTGAYSTDVVLHSLVRQNAAEIRLQTYDPSIKAYTDVSISFGEIKSDGILGKDKTLGENEVEFYIQELQNILHKDEGAENLLNFLESEDPGNIEIALSIIKGKIAEARTVRKSEREAAEKEGVELKESDLYRSIYEDVQDAVDAKNANRRDISEVLAERQNIAMDNAKELVMSRVNLNSETLDVDKVLVLLGFDLDENGLSIPFYFLSQPIIEDYVKLINYAKSNVSPFIADKEAYALNELAKKYGYDGNGPLTENEKEMYDSEMTGEKLKEEIEAFGIDNDVENSLDIGFQQAVLEKFIMLKRHGEQLRKVQKNLNVDSQGLGKSTFDTIDRMQRIEELAKNEHVANSEALIGEYKPTLNVSEKKAQELIDDGFIRLDEFFIRPTTISGIVSVNTISAANNLWSNYLPYNSEVMKNVFKEIMELRSIGVDAEVEAKQQVLQEMKKYLNSMDMGLYTLQPDQERERLFIDSENNNSLATYLNEITKITGNKAIDIYINKNRLIERLEYQSNKNTDVSLIKFNNSVGENFDEDAMYNALLVLMDKEIELPPHNGKPYNTRMLAQDLMNYALLEGGVQEAVQFSKFIPVEFLNKTSYSKSMENINLGNVFDNVFGTQSNSAKEITPYAVSNFTRQYAQHYPNLMPKTNDKNKDMGNIKRKEEKLPNGTTIKYIESFTMGKKGLAGKPFLAIYNSSDKRKGKKKKFDLYEFNGVEYVRIPTLGTFGMSEYDANTTKVKGSVIGVNTSSNKPVNQVVSKTQQKKEPAPEKNIPHKIGDGNIYDTIESIANEDYPGLSAMAKALLPFVDNTVKLTAMPFKNNTEAYGAYSRNHHTIGMNVLTMSSRNPEDTARTLLHEYVHSITVKELQKWVEFDANDQIVSLKEGAPKPIENLVRLFNDTKNHFESILSEDGKTSQLDMLKLKMSTKPKQPLTAHEHDVVYGAYNIFEFLTLSTTSPKFQQYMANTEVKQSGKTVMEKFREIMKDLLTNMGVIFEPPNIATSAIAETFKLLEIVKTEKDSKFTIDESTDKNSKLLEKVDNALPKKQPENTTKLFKDLKGKDKTGLQERITKKLPLIANPNAKKHVPKELVKTKIATQYIGDGSPNSSTDRYKKMYAEEGVANTGAYTSSDVIYVSSNGKRGGRVNPVKDGVLQGEYINVQKAMDAGATIVMDTAAHLKKTAGYNIGELALAKYLKDNGYKREGVSGIWKPVVQPTTQPVIPTEPTPTKITYTPAGKQKQTYIIKGNKIFNSKGKEVFSEDSVDRNKIFANLAVKQGRAKVVTYKNKKYIVNDKNVIISGVTGKIMKWGENDGNRKAILKLAKPEESKPAKKLKFGKKGPSGFDFSKIDDADVVDTKKKIDFGDGDVIFDPAKMTREQELEQKFKLRHPTGRRKTYLKKNYKSTLAKTIKLNKANTDSTFKFKMIEVMGEKGDRRTYNAIAVVPVTPVAINPDKNFSSKQVKKIDKLIENFEKTCK